ncbi:MAG: patatin-like phospholipase family protein [Caldilineaceae bacterium]
MMNRKWYEDLPKPVAFALSGGASLGSVQVGMIRALRDAGIYPDLVVGSSVGSLNAAAIACYGLDAAVDVLETTWSQLRRHDIFPGGVLAQALCLLRTRQSLFRQDRLAKLIARIQTDPFIENLSMPLGILATELATYEGVLFTAGKLQSALLASTAIPGLYPPVQIEDKWYIDGSCTENVPLRAAMQMGAGSIVVLDTGNVPRAHRTPRHVGDLLHAVVRGTVRQRVLLEAPLIAQHLPVIYLPAPSLSGIGFMDFDRSSELMHQAETTVTQFLAITPPPKPGVMSGSLRCRQVHRQHSTVQPESTALGQLENPRLSMDFCGS